MSLASFARRHRNEFGLLLAILLVLGVAVASNASWQNSMTAAYNAKILVRSASVLGIFALGAGVVIIAGGIDLSAGSVIAFSATSCGCFLLFLADKTASGQPDMIHLTGGTVAVAVAGTLAVGVLIGSFHAWLITAIRLPPFVATLASLVGLRSLARILIPDLVSASSGGTMKGVSKITVQDAGRVLRGVYDIDNWYIAPLILLVLSLAIWVLLTKTVVGRHLYAMGGNEEAARLSGIRTDRLKWLAYCISAVTASIAGVLLLAETSTADPSTQALGLELYAIAAAVIGGCALTGGVGSVAGILLGAMFLRTVIDSVAKIARGVSPDELEGLVVGLLVLLAVAFNELRSGSGVRRPFFAGWLGLVNLGIISGLFGVIAAVLAPVSKLPVGLAVAAATLLLLLVKKALELRAERRG
jgi:ribose/xylose/arabinose/galactoside ABC-type transport system permease subunit